MIKIRSIILENPISRFIRTLFSMLFIFLVRIYQYIISPVLPKTCRFTPSCSEYAIGSFRTHGVITGLFLSIRRVLRCNPWGGHGHDPVPEKGFRFSELKKSSHTADTKN